MKNKNGKTIKYIFLIGIGAITLYSYKSQEGKAGNVVKPNQRIVEVIKQRDSSKDFEMMPYCFDKNEIINDTLIVQFYTRNLI